jgi:hypothetical protein
MPASRPTAMQTEAVNHDRRQALLNVSRLDPRPARSGSTLGSNQPEWTTERWKLQVEAEARSRLKKRIRDVASER